MAPQVSEPLPPRSGSADARTALGVRHILCAVLDGASLGEDPRARAGELFEAGVDWIQLRDRRVEDRALWQIACALLAARDECNQNGGENPYRRVIVNKRVDLAHAAGADGVHFGFDSIAPETSRLMLAPGALLGASLHSISEVEGAVGGTLDYAHLAPIWNPISKPATRPELGLDCLAEACRTGLPIFAQGGVDADRARDAVRAGAAGIAVTGILLYSGDAHEIVRPLRESLDVGNDSPAG